jgi:dihydrofolate reductase
MKARRKIIVYIATSADGYIARPDGDVEWLNRRPNKFDYGMTAFYRTIDTILWGRKTYDWLLAYHKEKGQKEGMFDIRCGILFSQRRCRNGWRPEWNLCRSR